MDIWNQFGAVIAVLGSLMALLLWLRKRGYLTSRLTGNFGAGRVRELKVVDRVIVSAQHTLVLLEVQDARMLVCLSPGGSSVTILKGEHQS
jgi:flagellar biogenesis protein FliO